MRIISNLLFGVSVVTTMNVVLGNDRVGLPYGTGCYDIQTHECTNAHCTKESCEASGFGGHWVGPECVDGKCCEGEGDVCELLGHVDEDNHYSNNGVSDTHGKGAPFGTGCYIVELHECTNEYCDPEVCEANGGAWIANGPENGGKWCEGEGDVCEVTGFLDEMASSGTSGTDNAPYGTGCYQQDIHECTNKYCTQQECEANGGSFIGSDCTGGKCCEGQGDVCEVLGYMSVDGDYILPGTSGTSGNGLSTAAIVGICVGIIAPMVMLFVAAVLVKRQGNQKQADTGAKVEFEDSENQTSAAPSSHDNQDFHA